MKLKSLRAAARRVAVALDVNAHEAEAVLLPILGELVREATDGVADGTPVVIPVPSAVVYRPAEPRPGSYVRMTFMVAAPYVTGTARTGTLKRTRWLNRC